MVIATAGQARHLCGLGVLLHRVRARLLALRGCARLASGCFLSPNIGFIKSITLGMQASSLFSNPIHSTANSQMRRVTEEVKVAEWWAKKGHPGPPRRARYPRTFVCASRRAPRESAGRPASPPARQKHRTWATTGRLVIARASGGPESNRPSGNEEAKATGPPENPGEGQRVQTLQE